MAEYTINNSPIHSDSTLSAVYGETGTYWQQFHTGDDFIPYGSTPNNPDIFSVSSGVVVEEISSHKSLIVLLLFINNYFLFK
jgi:hypothetical protein